MSIGTQTEIKVLPRLLPSFIFKHKNTIMSVVGLYSVCVGVVCLFVFCFFGSFKFDNDVEKIFPQYFMFPFFFNNLNNAQGPRKKNASY